MNAGPFTTDKPDLYCTSLGLQEPSGTVWTNNAGPFGQKTSAFGQAPWAGSVGQPASQGTVKSPAGSVGKVTIDEETPAASATVPAARTDTPGNGLRMLMCSVGFTDQQGLTSRALRQCIRR